MCLANGALQFFLGEPRYYDKYDNGVIVMIDRLDYKYFNQLVFRNKYYTTGNTGSLNRLYSKIINIFLDESTIYELGFYGVQISKITQISDIKQKITAIMELELHMSFANIQYGVNQQIISQFGINDKNRIFVDSYFYSQKHYRLMAYESEFMIRPGDNKYEIVKHQIKIALMYPFRQKVEHFNTNQVTIIEGMSKEVLSSIQLTLCNILARNSNYLVYITQVEEVLKEGSYLRIGLKDSGDTGFDSVYIYKNGGYIQERRKIINFDVQIVTRSQLSLLSEIQI